MNEEIKRLDSHAFVENDAIDYQTLLDCFLQIAESIRYIHIKGYICGDIKYKNIYLDSKNRKFLLFFGKEYFSNTNVESSIECDIKYFALHMLEILCACFDIEFSSNIDSNQKNR